MIYQENKIGNKTLNALILAGIVGGVVGLTNSVREMENSVDHLGTLIELSKKESWNQGKMIEELNAHNNYYHKRIYLYGLGTLGSCALGGYGAIANLRYLKRKQEKQ